MTDERLIIGENGVPRPNPALPDEPPEGEPEQFAGEPFARHVVSYLLGQMSEAESERFEDECFAQRTWPSHIELVEEDLVDAYLHEELPPGQRELFERNYLTTEARQERVKTAAALLHQVCEPNVLADPPIVKRERVTWAERLKAVWGSGWGLRAVTAVAVLVIIVGGSWLYLTRARPPRAIATLTLTSAFINRSEGVEAHTIKLPPDADALRVFLTLPEGATPAPRYRVELDDEDGETMPLAVDGQDARAVSVLLPASRLSRGQQYALTLFALRDDGTEQPVYGSYVFAVE
jgi:hypothetical protein